MNGWSSDVHCCAAAQKVLKRLETAGWTLDRRAGEYAMVACGCPYEHFARVILWPVLPSVLEENVRSLEKTTCLGALR